MPKKQKVRFHKGDQRPGGFTGTLSYVKKMKKKKERYYLASDRKTYK